MSTTTPGSCVLVLGEPSPSTAASVHLSAAESLSLLKLSAKGKQPRLVVSAARERSNAQIRSQMQDARVTLGQELYGQSPKTLASVRLSRGYSQQQLATAIGTSQPAIAKLEAGSVNILWTTGKRLAVALGISLPELDEMLIATAKISTTVAT